MATTSVSADLKNAVKAALREMLQDERELLHGVLADVLEDVGLREAIREGMRTKRADRKEIMTILDVAS